MSNHDTGTTSTLSLTMEQTDDVAMNIDDVLKDKPDLVKVLTNGGNIERSLLLRELLMNAYVRGFFSGIQHAVKDVGLTGH